MAVNSLGYQGKITDRAYAAMQPYIGKGPVVDKGGLNLSVVTGVDRTVRLTPGTAWGYGVLDTLTTNTDIVLPVVSSGTRYDTIVRRLNFTDKTSTFGYVTGGASAVVAGSLASDIAGTGVVEQPLFLVKLVAGNTAPQQIIRLAEFTAQGNMRSFSSVTARDYWMPSPFPGSLAYIDDGTFGPDTGLTEYARDSNHTYSWRVYDSGTLPVALASGIVSRSGPPAGHRVGGLVTLMGSFKHADNTNLASAEVLGTLPSDVRPQRSIEVPIATAPKIDGSAAMLVIGSNGVLTPYLHVGVSFVSIEGVSYRVSDF